MLIIATDISMWNKFGMWQDQVEISSTGRASIVEKRAAQVRPIKAKLKGCYKNKGIQARP